MRAAVRYRWLPDMRIFSNSPGQSGRTLGLGTWRDLDQTIIEQDGGADVETRMSLLPETKQHNEGSETSKSRTSAKQTQAMDGILVSGILQTQQREEWTCSDRPLWSTSFHKYSHDSWSEDEEQQNCQEGGVIADQG